MGDSAAPRAFVLISFESEFDDIYERLIKAPLEGAGYLVERADSRLDQQNILRDVVGGIAGADLIVADLTGLNANVFYELGLAHALQIPTILITQDLETLPFDLRAYRANEYSTYFTAYERIVETLVQIARAHLQGDVAFGSPVTDFLPADQLPRSREPLGAREAPEQPDRPPEEELGFVDIELMATEGSAQFTDGLDGVTEATEAVGAKIIAFTQELDILNANPGSHSAKTANFLAMRIAADLNAYADEIEARLPAIEAGADRFGESIQRRVALLHEFPDFQDEDQLAAFRAMLEALLASTRESLDGIRAYRESVRGIRGFSRHVTGAAMRIVRGLDALIGTSESLEAQASRALAVLETLGERDRGSPDSGDGAASSTAS